MGELIVGIERPGPAGLPLGRQTHVRPRRESISIALLVVCAMWVLLTWEPDWWLASHGAEAARRVPTLGLALLIAVALAKARRLVCWPMALFVTSHLIGLAIATNRGFALQDAATIRRR